MIPKGISHTSVQNPTYEFPELDPHVLGLSVPEPLLRGTDPDPAADPSLFS